MPFAVVCSPLFFKRSACLALALFACSAWSADRDPKKLNVLFIGNSLTSTNNLPGMIAGMAAASGRELNFTAHLVGGSTLKKHWDDGKALAKIQAKLPEGKLDFVVLQDLSREAYKDREAMDHYVELFDAEIRKAGARTMLYMTWALENDPDDFSKIEEAYTSLAKKFHAQLVPAGAAWRAITSAPGKPAFQLYVPDHKHPKPIGTYLTACVFYRALFGAPSEGLPSRIEWKTKVLADLSKEDASALQKIADKIPLLASE